MVTVTDTGLPGPLVVSLEDASPGLSPRMRLAGGGLLVSLSPLASPPLPPAPPGGQDLREECIKLKKRVFDLERQNQMLSTLLQQKLQLTASSLPQVGRAPPLPPRSPLLRPCGHSVLCPSEEQGVRCPPRRAVAMQGRPTRPAGPDLS